ATKLERNSVGVELSKEYFELGQKRIKESHLQKTIWCKDYELILLNEKELAKIDYLKIPKSGIWDKERYIKQAKEKFEQKNTIKQP
ncbi:MAG: hypothetical protein COS14_02425, partial [Bacteroidetes bacterium CG02_land_8_20_14_3_00_31_25]